MTKYHLLDINMMTRILCGMIIFIISSNVYAELSSTWVKKTIPDEIWLCWHEAYPYAASDLVDGGLVTDFVRTVMLEAGFKPKMIFVPWARCKNGVKTGQYDLLFAMWNYVDQHQRDFDFLKATDIEHTSYLVLEDSPLKKAELENFENIRVGLHVDGGYDDEIIKHEGFHLLYMQNNHQKLKMLLANRVDMIIGDPATANSYLDRYFKDKNIQLRTLLPHIQVQKTSPAIAKNNPHKKEIIRRYNEAYERLCEDGTLQNIIHKHNFYYAPIDCPDRKH